MMWNKEGKSIAYSVVLHGLIFILLGGLGVGYSQREKLKDVHVVQLVTSKAPGKQGNHVAGAVKQTPAQGVKQKEQPISPSKEKVPTPQNIVAQQPEVTEKHPVSTPVTQAEASNTDNRQITESASSGESGAAAGSVGAGAGAGATTDNGTGNGSGAESKGAGDGDGDTDYSKGPSGQGRGNYDPVAVRRSIQGSVTIRALLGANGAIQSASVAASSGNATIDSMGMRDIYNASYTPRLGKDGKPTACYITRTFTYTLR